VFDALLRNFRWHRTADRWGPRRLLVVDFADEGAAAVVVGRSGTAVHCLRSATLPALRLPEAVAGGAALAELRRFAQDVQYVSALAAGEDSYVRLLNVPGRPGKAENVAQQVRQTLGVDEQFEVRHAVVRVQDGEGGGQFMVLAAAFRREGLEGLARAFGEAGFTPVSLSHRGVAAAGLAEALVPDTGGGASSGFLHVGSSFSMLLLYAEGALAIARQFRLGTDLVVQSLMESLNLDHDTAAKVLASGSVDVTANLSPAVKSWMHQIAISLDFMERRYGKRVETLHLLAGGAGARMLREILAASINRAVECPSAHASLAGIEFAGGTGLADDACLLAVHEGRRIMQRGASHGL